MKQMKTVWKLTTKKKVLKRRENTCITSYSLLFRSRLPQYWNINQLTRDIIPFSECGWLFVTSGGHAPCVLPSLMSFPSSVVFDPANELGIWLVFSYLPRYLELFIFSLDHLGILVDIGVLVIWLCVQSSLRSCFRLLQEVILGYFNHLEWTH